MPTYSVEITTTITKVYNVAAPNEDRAAEVAHQLFTLEPEDNEKYEQEVLNVEEVHDATPLDGEYEE
jgi:hypothetical protein